MDVRSKIATSKSQLQRLNSDRTRLTKEIDDLNQAVAAGNAGAPLGNNAPSPAVLREKIKTSEQALERVKTRITELDFDQARRQAQDEVNESGQATRELEGRKNKLDAMLIRGRGHSELQVWFGLL